MHRERRFGRTRGPYRPGGCGLGSSFGQWFRLSEARIRNLVACGAAAGIAATFNAPIAGVIFAMEIILGELRLGDMGNVVISAVTASTVARIFLGDRPAFSIPKYAIRTPWEILLYAFLGVLAALTAVAFIKMLYSIESRFDRARLPEAIKPAVGGLMLGGLAFFYPIVLGLGLVPEKDNLIGLPPAASLPHIFGSGFPVIEAALLGKLSIGLLVALILLKPLATSLTLGSGNSGGVFAPALFTGAALGGAFGLLVERLAPGATAGPGAFATVGMASVFAGAAHAPFTGFLIVFEMTDDYLLIIPLMAGVIVSHIVSERLHRDSIYTLKLTLRGIRLESGRDIDAMEAVRIDEVMVREPVTVQSSMPIAQLASEFLRTGRHGFPVLNDDSSLYGVVSLEDYRRAMTDGNDHAESLVRDIATRDMVTVYPDDTVATAMRRMAPRDLSRLPVVDRRNPRELLGVVRRNDILRAYDIALARRTAIRSGKIESGATTVSGLDATEITVDSSSAIVGKRVSQIDWPRECVIATIWRKERQIIPHGETTIEPGDILVVVGHEAIADQIRSLIQPNAGS